jgi:hypothetical protein
MQVFVLKWRVFFFGNGKGKATRRASVCRFRRAQKMGDTCKAHPQLVVFILRYIHKYIYYVGGHKLVRCRLDNYVGLARTIHL